MSRTHTSGKFKIEDSVIVITGGEGVLGGTLATAFASLGAVIIILGINEESGTRLKQDISEAGGRVEFYNTNVLHRDELTRVSDDVVRQFGRIDVLINAAGGNMDGATIGEHETFFDLDPDDFRKVSELNLDGTVIPSLVFAKQMSLQKKGVILNFSSMTSQRAVSRVAGYSAAKAAVENFTKWLAVEMATKFGEGIRVNAIAPGFLVTNQNRDLLLDKNNKLTTRGKTIIDHTPFGRFGEPEELTGTVLWLISDASSFVTGTVIPVDGGFSAYSGV